MNIHEYIITTRSIKELCLLETTYPSQINPSLHVPLPVITATNLLYPNFEESIAAFLPKKLCSTLQLITLITYSTLIKYTKYIAYQISGSDESLLL